MPTAPKSPSPKRRSDGEATRKRFLAAALASFRDQGFDATTMRDVAKAAGLSLGAAYHYFPGKEAIVLAYYVELEQRFSARIEPALAGAGSDLRTRLGRVFDIKFEVLRRDRKLMAALFRTAGDPESSLSPFAAESSAVRTRNVAHFLDALSVPACPEELRRPLAEALFVMHLALMLLYLHDRSPRQARSASVTAGLLDAVCDALPLLASPLGAALRPRLFQVLGDVATIAGLRGDGD